MCKEASDALGFNNDDTLLTVLIETNSDTDKRCRLKYEFGDQMEDSNDQPYPVRLEFSTCNSNSNEACDKQDCSSRRDIDESCLCVYAPLCTTAMHHLSGSKCTCENNKGGIVNGGECFCGTNICSGLNLFCSKADNRCTDKPSNCIRPDPVPEGYKITKDPSVMSTLGNSATWGAGFVGKCDVLNGWYGSSNVDTPPTAQMCSGSISSCLLPIKYSAFLTLSIKT